MTNVALLHLFQLTAIPRLQTIQMKQLGDTFSHICMDYRIVSHCDELSLKSEQWLLGVVHQCYLLGVIVWLTCRL